MSVLIRLNHAGTNFILSSPLVIELVFSLQLFLSTLPEEVITSHQHFSTAPFSFETHKWWGFRLLLSTKSSFHHMLIVFEWRSDYYLSAWIHANHIRRRKFVGWRDLLLNFKDYLSLCQQEFLHWTPERSFHQKRRIVPESVSSTESPVCHNPNHTYRGLQIRHHRHLFSVEKSSLSYLFIEDSFDPPRFLLMHSHPNHPHMTKRATWEKKKEVFSLFIMRCIEAGCSRVCWGLRLRRGREKEGSKSGQNKKKRGGREESLMS